MNNNPRTPIQFNYARANRFYGPVILLAGLNVACIGNRPVYFPDTSTDAGQSPEQVFHDFLNKLAQLCDIERGGNTVTAITALKFPNMIQYRFTSNSRTSEDYVCARNFIISLLNTLDKAERHELQEMTSKILRTSLSFSRPRVEAYVNTLKEQAKVCINASEGDNTDESRSVVRELNHLQQKLLFSNDTELKDDEFSQHCENLIMSIDRLYKSEIEGLIRDRTREGRMNESKCWCELRHAAGRLLSYLRATKTLISTRERWPELFEKFEVCYTGSSTPGPHIFRGKNSPEKLSANLIIGRMTSDPGKLDEYRAYAQELQKCGLDNIIRSKATWQRFRPIVHSEVLLLDWLERDGGTHPSNFFNGYKYIGCSKPTCRLCDYYFLVHPSGVHVRPPHRNLYTNWRMPDVYENQGPRAKIDREKLMDKILELLRKDTFRTLIEKLPEGKRHDSNTDPTYSIYSISGGRAEGMKHLVASQKDLEVDSSNYEKIRSTAELDTFDERGEFAPEGDDVE